MFVWRVLIADLFPQGENHLEGLDEFLSTRAIKCQRLAPHHLSYLLNCRAAFGKNDNLEATVREACYKLDSIVEQEVNTLSAVFTVRARITAPELSSFIALLDKNEYEIAEGNVPKLNWLHFENVRLVDTEKAARFIIYKRPEIGGLLAAAVNAYSPAAALAAYVRVFEAAFALPHNQLKKPLHRFLASGHLGISKKNSDNWIDLRHKMVHADRTGNAGFDGYAYPHLESIKHAAYDIAFNKKYWKRPDAERLNSGCLAAIVTSGPNVSTTLGVFSCFDIVASEPLGRYPRSTYKAGAAFNWKSLFESSNEPTVMSCHGIYDVFGLRPKASLFGQQA